MAVIIYCRSCWIGLAVVGQIPSICPECLNDNQPVWTSYGPKPSPVDPYRLSKTDCAFLRGLKISTS